MIPLGVLAQRQAVGVAIVPSFVASRQATGSASSYSFTSVPLGDEASSRIVLVAVTGNGYPGNDHTITALTVGGISATCDAEYHNGGTSAGGGCAFFRAAVPTGTTATVEVTFASSRRTATIAAWTVNEAIAFHATNGYAGYSTGGSVSSNIPKGGFGLGAVVRYSRTSAISGDFAQRATFGAHAFGDSLTQNGILQINVDSITYIAAGCVSYTSA